MDYLSDLYESLKLTFEIFLVLCVIWSIWINQLELTLVFELPSRVREEETCVSLVIPTTVQGLAESSCLRNQHVWETLAEKAASCLSRCSTSSCVLRSSAEFGKPGVLLSAGPCSLCRKRLWLVWEQLVCGRGLGILWVAAVFLFWQLVPLMRLRILVLMEILPCTLCCH